MTYDCFFRHRYSQASSSSSSSSANVKISPSTIKVVETKMTYTSAISHVCIESVRQSTLIYLFISMLMSKSRFSLIYPICMQKQGIDEAAEKQRIKKEKEKEDDPAEREHQLRLAANEEAKVSNVVDSSCKLTQYVLPIA